MKNDNAACAQTVSLVVHIIRNNNDSNDNKVRRWSALVAGTLSDAYPIVIIIIFFWKYRYIMDGRNRPTGQLNDRTDLMHYNIILYIFSLLFTHIHICGRRRFFFYSTFSFLFACAVWDLMCTFLSNQGRLRSHTHTHHRISSQFVSRIYGAGRISYMFLCHFQNIWIFRGVLQFMSIYTHSWFTGRITWTQLKRCRRRGWREKSSASRWTQ